MTPTGPHGMVRYDFERDFAIDQGHYAESAVVAVAFFSFPGRERAEPVAAARRTTEALRTGGCQAPAQILGGRR